MFRLPLTLASFYLPLTQSALQGPQTELQDLRYLIIDEKSMISLDVLYWVDQRCRQIVVHERELPFGGLNVVLAGDFYHLTSVAAKPLFFTGTSWRPELMQARELYLQVNQTVELDEVVRQQGDRRRHSVASAG
ncbi:uncharacterized protein N7515_003896 [Penicillium bovifimosum]|uniref:ATP-dependent DNA helicase n=1 Tax=Penicillium bovifimosum TaxID=126998 RepID=A0A9W9L542_9EURO|nr:uncharacterized protein N7515_003896 [Penicillium bovifimosum]KAJ5139048.1 hypothetical protein N7515_003896 [Penicillium bovifimosum]